MARKKMTIEILSRGAGESHYVAVPKKHYEKLAQYAVETNDALDKIKRGRQDAKTGKLKEVTSIEELL